ncbi:MAG: glycosyltransferase [Nitrospirae bacterium]|nr:MAG: glycosyltransferase [Nitrospirota bacterium]
MSIIIPVLNEGATLDRTLSALHIGQGEELIIVDGGSTDDTVEIASRYTEKIYKSGKGRARQMNYGAEKADGDILLFLHADCKLPSGAFTLIRNTLKNDNVSFGAFDITYPDRSICLGLVSFFANLRSRITSIAYGDQGIFLRKETFLSVGGFPDIPLMEDIEISRRLKRLGRARFITPPITASPRRFKKEGIVYTVLRDWRLALSYTIFKTPPEKLIKYYRDVR